MAVEHLQSPAIQNREAAPQVLNNPALGSGADAKIVKGHIASLTAAASIGSTIRFFEVPSNAIVHEVKIASAAQTAGAVDVGLYKNVKNGGTVIDADFFGSAVSVASAVPLTDITNESGIYTVVKQNQPLWQAAGLTSDPKTTFDVVATVTTNVTTGTGAMLVMAEYTQ
jgi:hypothetical protein